MTEAVSFPDHRLRKMGRLSRLKRADEQNIHQPPRRNAVPPNHFRFQNSSTERQCLCVALSLFICGNLLYQQLETNAMERCNVIQRPRHGDTI